MVYPLSVAEDRMVRWAARVVPAVALATILLLGAITVAATQA